MAKEGFFGIDSNKRNWKKCYSKIGGTIRELKEAWANIGGNMVLVWRSTVPAGEVVFTASDVWTVPDGVSVIDIFCVGGGGGNGGNYYMSTYQSGATAYKSVDRSGAYGGAGYTTVQIGASVSPGDELAIVVGTGGSPGNDLYSTSDSMSGSTPTQGSSGSESSVTGNGISVKAPGGTGGLPGSTSYYYRNGADGGSGSGCSGSSEFEQYENGGYYNPPSYYRGNGGTDGGNGKQASMTNAGGTTSYYGTPGKGQGSTTRAFGESTGTLYSTAERSDDAPNTGNSGSSGIVIIRWAEQ